MSSWSVAAAAAGRFFVAPAVDMYVEIQDLSRGAVGVTIVVRVQLGGTINILDTTVHTLLLCRCFRFWL